MTLPYYRLSMEPPNPPKTSNIIDQYISEFPLNVRGNMTRLAETLARLYPEKNFKAWLSAVERYKRNQRSAEEAIKSELEYSISHNTETTSVFYNDTTDTYVTYLIAAGENVVIAGDMHRAMKAAYSNMSGNAATINEIAREFNFPRNWFDEYRRRHGWTHDMDPYTDEEIIDTDTDELVDDLVLRRRRDLHKKFERKKWKDIQEDALKWRHFDETIMMSLKELPVAPKTVSQLKMRDALNPFSIVMSPTDFHWGKHGWVDEVGESYNFDEARSRLMDRTEEILSWLPGRPDTIILATGSDWFHVDNDMGQTTRGTPQDMCGSPAQILITGCKLAREHIDVLRQVAPVEVVFMAGNHDRHSALALMLYLSAAYEDVDDVSIRLDPKTRHYARYGNTLLGFTHGDKIAKNKLPTLMSKEQRILWGQTESHIWFTGHLHHQAIHELEGGLVIQLPSLAGHDRYHYREGYTCAKAGLAAHIIDKELGLIGSLFSPVR